MGKKVRESKLSKLINYSEKRQVMKQGRRRSVEEVDVSDSEWEESKKSSLNDTLDKCSDKSSGERKKDDLMDDDHSPVKVKKLKARKRVTAIRRDSNDSSVGDVMKELDDFINE